MIGLVSGKGELEVGRSGVVCRRLKGLGRLTLAGKLIFTIVPVLLVLTVGLIAVLVLLGPTILQFLGDNLWLVRFVVAATAILLMTIPTAFIVGYMELKGIAFMNLRIGPDRVGPWGTGDLGRSRPEDAGQRGLQPDRRRSPGLHAAPVVVFMASVMSLLVIPFAPGLFGQDMNIALLTSSRSAG